MEHRSDNHGNKPVRSPPKRFGFADYVLTVVHTTTAIVQLYSDHLNPVTNPPLSGLMLDLPVTSAKPAATT